MKMMMMKMILIFPLMTSFLKNPMSMGMLLMMQTLLSTMIMSLMLKTSWFPMITFLMMIGGLMIIFMYMTSISSNEKFKLNLKIMLMMIIMMVIPLESMISEIQINENMDMKYKTIEKLSLMKMYSKKSISMCLLMVMYLLLSMITISKIVKHNEGPLRSKNYE
uniref:NADH dehydrogenase subunit 6 n=1 Tax=Gessius rufidorsus TaxID=1971641 RepID=A0A6C0MD40_9HEMI|nr:NADH dehydrogenase subunit 6 [Gessius sp. 'rufidorsus']